MKSFLLKTNRINLIWKKHETYKLTELKDKIKKCIDLDDDILTQFVEADFFKYNIEKASNFSEIVEALNKYRFEVENEENIFKENNEWDSKKQK